MHVTKQRHLAQVLRVTIAIDPAKELESEGGHFAQLRPSPSRPWQSRFKAVLGGAEGYGFSRQAAVRAWAKRARQLATRA